MGFRKPNDLVYGSYCCRRWQKEWMERQTTIKTSGLLQEAINNIIKEKDPDYYSKHNGIEKKIISK